MGLKTGCAAVAAQRKLFVILNTADGHPYLLAEVKTLPSGEFQLVYPDGSRGILRRCQNFQLELAEVIPNTTPGWEPSDDQKLALMERLPKERIIFNGSYLIGNRSESDFPPPPMHINDAQRFQDPHGPWEQIVAMYLGKGRKPVLGT